MDCLHCLKMGAMLHLDSKSIMEKLMNLTINGNSEAGDFSRVTDVLQKMDLDPKLVVVELNGKILPKNEYASTALKEGDVLEIVQFVAGG